MPASHSSILVVPGSVMSVLLPIREAVAFTTRQSRQATPESVRAADVAMISHELRNSLSVLTQAARLLRLLPGPDNTERALTLIERHVRQMSRHIEDLVDTTPLKLHADLLKRTNVDLTLILQNCVDVSSAEMARRHHKLQVVFPAESVWIKADAMRLEQVFSNLLSNAAKYTPDGGTIALSLELLGGEILVRVRDSGIGIPRALLTKIFEMFVQVNSTATVPDGGRGIGLAVVRDLVEMHGGHVTAASAGLGFGSEFTVMLPALREQDGGVG